MTKQRLEKIFDIIFIILFVFLVVGIPLAFTSYTRSVFEVNKMMLMRLVTLVTLVVWYLRSILVAAVPEAPTNNDDGRVANSESYSDIAILGLRWKKAGLEKIALVWIVFNVISLIFSQNMRISFIGAYDRWEGIITITNYMVVVYMFAKLIRTRTQLFWVIGGILVSTFASAIYGISQSFNYDFMHWSVDASKRVFACINNPVHFCAYVAMVVPMGLALLLYISSKNQKDGIESMKRKVLKWSIFIATAFIYYSQFLSFSRAAWMGFVGSMTMFYLLVSESFDREDLKSFCIDFFFTGIAIAAFYLVAIFGLHMKSLWLGLAISSVLGAYLYYSLKIAQKSEGEEGDLQASDLLLTLVCVLVIFINYTANLSFLGTWPTIGIHAALTTYFVSIAIRIRGPVKFFLGRIVLILIFTKLQYVSISGTSIFLYYSLLISYYFLALKGNVTLLREKKFWLISYLFIFATIIILPTIPNYLQKIFDTKDVGSLRAIKNVESRLGSYSRDALYGTARTSMWKSALPWIKDHWLIGSGPDTVKYMYPDYRRPDYGILEGGHNFTPDRLHNEYINTLATRGIPGFLIYYGGFILGWLILMLKGYYRLFDNPIHYLLAGIIASATIYLGQMMFNFGVVATLALFYISLGIGLAIVGHREIQNG